MKVLSVFSLLCVFLLFVGFVHPNPDEGFDHYHLVMQWTESLCRAGEYECHPYRPYYFTIHGLWPQNKNDGEVNCSTAELPPFDYSQINETALISDLEKFWPNAATVNYTNEGFWRDEWNLHGECPTERFGPETAQREYFSRTVALAKVNLTEALFKSGIKPGNTYKVEEIKNAVVNATTLVPRLECNADVNGTLQLYQVRFCVDLDAKTFQNCTYTATCCFRNSQIAFPDPTVSTSPRDNNIALPNPTVSTSPRDNNIALPNPTVSASPHEEL